MTMCGRKADLLDKDLISYYSSLLAPLPAGLHVSKEPKAAALRELWVRQPFDRAEAPCVKPPFEASRSS